MLTFSPANAKTKALYQVMETASYLTNKRKVYSLDLPAGYSCPGAKECLSRAVPRQDDPSRFTIQDGKDCRFRCFSASQDVQYPDTRNMRQRNLEALKGAHGWRKCRDLILGNLPSNTGIIRYHVSGDFFKRAYLDGAIAAAKERPNILFYAYTKSLHFIRGSHVWAPLRSGMLAPNFMVTASRGGKYDELIDKLNMREAHVIFSEGEAGNLPIDHNDSHASTRGGSFCLILHGTQPAKSKASIALVKLRGKGSYAK